MNFFNLERIWSSLKNLDITNNIKEFNGSVYIILYTQKADFKEWRARVAQ